MADQWYYSQQGQRVGPVSEEQISHLVSSGQIQPTDLIWKQGMAQWSQASQIFPPPPSDPNAPPPIPEAPQPTQLPKALTGVLDTKNRLLLGYRIALAMAAISAFLPWAQASGSASFMGNVNSASASVGGMSTTWGMLTLLVALGGIFFTFLKPATILKEKTTIGMAAVGGVIALLAIIGMATSASHFGSGVNYADAYGNQASSSAGAGIGIYIALIAGAVSGVLGFVNKWDQ
jgi:hypothetical protein